MHNGAITSLCGSHGAACGGLLLGKYFTCAPNLWSMQEVSVIFGAQYDEMVLQRSPAAGARQQRSTEPEPAPEPSPPLNPSPATTEAKPAPEPEPVPDPSRAAASEG